MLKSLEERLTEIGHLAEFAETLAPLQSELQDIVKTLFGVSHALSQAGLQDDYVIYGGYSVLLQFLSTFGAVQLMEWRGSYDLDIVGNEAVVDLIKQHYAVISDRRSEKVKGKRTLRLATSDPKRTIKIDIRQREVFQDAPDEVYARDVETVNIYGITFNVISPLRQLKNKLSVTRELDRDRYDVFTLLGILRERDTLPTTIADYLSLRERRVLYNFLKGHQITNILNEENIIFIGIPKPTYKAYVMQLKPVLKKRGI